MQVHKQISLYLEPQIIQMTGNKKLECQNYPKRAFILPQLFNCKLLILIFFISSNFENINNGFIILGAIGN